DRLFQCSANARRYEAKLRAAGHLQRCARMMRQHEDRRVVRRLIAPPAFPAVVWPRATNRAKHVASDNPGADSAKSLFGHGIVDSSLAIVGAAVHGAPDPSLKEPLHQLQAPDTERILQILVRPGAVAVDGDAKVQYAKSGHELSSA